MILSIIIPVYNEEKTVLKSLQSLKDLNKNLFQHEVIVVNDGSQDSTSKILNENKNLYDKLLTNETNKGKGFSIKKGIIEAKGTHIICHDADLEYNPQDILPMMKLAESNKNIDVVLGSRFIGNKTRRNIYLRTFFANKFLSFLFSILNRRKVTDVATCYKLIKSEIYQNTELTKNGFEYEIEILSKALEYSSDFAEVPIDYNARTYQEGKKIKFSDGFKYILCIFKYRIKN